MGSLPTLTPPLQARAQDGEGAEVPTLRHRPRERGRNQSVLSTPRSPPSLLPTPQTPVLGPQAQPPHPGGAPPGSVRPETPAGRRVRALTPGPESLPTTGPAGSLRPPPPLPAGFRPPAEIRTPPTPSPCPPHNSSTQNPTRERPRRCARQLARDPRGRREAGGGGARREPVGPRCTGASPARRPGHSLDEVAGALLREALLPAAGQVCGNAKKSQVKLGPPGRAPPECRPPPRLPRAYLSGSCGPS